jgi:MOSC domain-containing protein YiiM
MSMSHGKLLGIAIRPKSRSPMIPLDRADVTTGEGVVGDSRGRPGSRQVTIVSREAWQAACDEIGQSLPWTVRRANLFVEDLELPKELGRQICIGQVVLEVCGETDPCARMDAQVSGLTAALTPDWRGGVCCRVITGGEIHVGDTVQTTS